MAMKKRLAREQLEYNIDEKPLEECLTAYAGLPMVAEAYRALGVRAAVEREVRVKERQRGISEADMVEDFVLMLAAGGGCLDDFATVGADKGLAAMLGRSMTGADAARKFLYRFHNEEAETNQPQGVLAWVVPETAPLEGLAKANEALIQRISERQPDLNHFTMDMDAPVIASHKAEAKMSYEGERGYQPEFAIWAETLVVLADEFRDGNVPAGMDPLTVVQRGFSALPAERMAKMVMAFRGDSACYNHDLLNWLRDEERTGPKGKIRFAISADMSQPLRREVNKLSESDWKPYRRPDGEAVASDASEQRQWADVVFVPTDGPTNKKAKPDRYIAIRIRKLQGELFADGTTAKHFAVVTNDWDPDGGKVLWWQRQKAGTVEQVHDMIQNGLGLGVLPCGRFGANAAWARINVITHNLLQALKWIAYPPEERKSHPKRLRLRFFVQAGRVTQSARHLWLRLVTAAHEIAETIVARAKLWAAASTTLAPS